MYPPTGMPVGTIVNLPPERLARFRRALGNCANKCSTNGKIEFRCKVGGHCRSTSSGERPPFYTNMSWLTHSATSDMFVCAENDPGRHAEWEVLHEMGRWCGYQYYGGNAPSGPPEYTSYYWDAVIQNLGSDITYYDIVGGAPR